MILANASTPELSATNKAIALEAIRAAFWRWYNQHERDVILSKRVLFFSLSVKVHDVRWLFVDIFGEPLAS